MRYKSILNIDKTHVTARFDRTKSKTEFLNNQPDYTYYFME